MKLHNKKTGEILECVLGSYPVSGDVTIEYVDENAESGYSEYARYRTLAELNAEWEDYKPQEPLIKDEKIRKAIEYLFPKYALVHIEKRGGKRLFEFGGVRVEINAPNENAIKHGLTYTIPELCGDDE